MTAPVTMPDLDTLLQQLEAELGPARADLQAVTRRSRAFVAASKRRQDEGLIAKLRRQLGLG